MRSGAGLSCLRLDSPKNAVEERVDENVAGGDAEFSEQTLQAAARFSHQDAADDGFVLCRVLPDDDHPGRAVQASAVEDRSPLDAELIGRVHIGLGVVLDQVREGRLEITGSNGCGIMLFVPNIITD